MYKLKINSVLTDDNGEKFFGNGPYELLKGVKEYGSLSLAAKAMNMSYSKAYHLIKRSEEVLGYKLISSRSGGEKGGGSLLSEKGEIFLSSYAEFSMANRMASNLHLDRMVFDYDLTGIRFIILASGKGKRFKENKLLYPIDGKPSISYLLDTLMPIKDNCIVSSIHKEVDEIAKAKGYICALHKDESLSSSIKEGLKIIEKPCATVFIQADQILFTLSSLMMMAKEYQKDNKSFYKLSYNGIKAAPTLFPEKYFNKLLKLEGEEGGSVVIKNDSSNKVKAVEALFPWEIWDLDSKEELAYFEDIISYIRREGR